MEKTIGELFPADLTDEELILFFDEKGHTPMEIQRYLGRYHEYNTEYERPSLDEIKQIIKQSPKT